MDAAEDKPTKLSDLVDEAPAPVKGPGGRGAGGVLVKALVLVALLAAVNWRQFAFLWDDWQTPNWSHGYLIPLFSIYLIYSRFGELVSCRRQVCWWGLAAVVLTAIMHVVAYRVRNPWSCQITLVMLVAALVLFLAGWRMFKLAWLPIMFLVFAMPVPETLYGKVSLPLQNFAAANATVLLNVGGVDIESTRSAMLVTTVTGEVKKLTVAEACSGMRLLMAFLALAVAMAYLADRPVWQRLIVVGMGVPAAVGANVLRVGITAFMFYIDKPALGQKFMHEFTGLLMLIPATLMLWFVAWLLARLFIEVDDEEPALAIPSEGGPA